ncbi:uncharacterized protein LOC101854580 [Aplysia californica]|uniref:Uncharacterized protein LOC101854580 n=1 Tax=Aplysia californica TaxID=6500 RepID=A0ABM1A1S8_APLCA|nr:uncharacterized protein LOC101854580 [Aplysia californica]
MDRRSSWRHYSKSLIEELKEKLEDRRTRTLELLKNSSDLETLQEVDSESDGLDDTSTNLTNNHGKFLSEFSGPQGVDQETFSETSSLAQSEYSADFCSPDGEDSIYSSEWGEANVPHRTQQSSQGVYHQCENLRAVNGKYWESQARESVDENLSKDTLCGDSESFQTDSVATLCEQDVTLTTKYESIGELGNKSAVRNSFLKPHSDAPEVSLISVKACNRQSHGWNYESDDTSPEIQEETLRPKGSCKPSACKSEITVKHLTGNEISRPHSLSMTDVGNNPKHHSLHGPNLIFFSNKSAVIAQTVERCDRLVQNELNRVISNTIQSCLRIRSTTTSQSSSPNNYAEDGDCTHMALVRCQSYFPQGDDKSKKGDLGAKTDIDDDRNCESEALGLFDLTQEHTGNPENNTDQITCLFKKISNIILHGNKMSPAIDSNLLPFIRHQSSAVENCISSGYTNVSANSGNFDKDCTSESFAKDGLNTKQYGDKLGIGQENKTAHGVRTYENTTRVRETKEKEKDNSLNEMNYADDKVEGKIFQASTKTSFQDRISTRPPSGLNSKWIKAAKPKGVTAPQFGLKREKTFVVEDLDSCQVSPIKRTSTFLISSPCDSEVEDTGTHREIYSDLVPTNPEASATKSSTLGYASKEEELEHLETRAPHSSPTFLVSEDIPSTDKVPLASRDITSTPKESIEAPGPTTVSKENDTCFDVQKSQDTELSEDDDDEDTQLSGDKARRYSIDLLSELLCSESKSENIDTGRNDSFEHERLDSKQYQKEIFSPTNQLKRDGFLRGCTLPTSTTCESIESDKFKQYDMTNIVHSELSPPRNRSVAADQRLKLKSNQRRKECVRNFRQGLENTKEIVNSYEPGPVGKLYNKKCKPGGQILSKDTGKFRVSSTNTDTTSDQSVPTSSSVKDWACFKDTRSASKGHQGKMCDAITDSGKMEIFPNQGAFWSAKVDLPRIEDNGVDELCQDVSPSDILRRKQKEEVDTKLIQLTNCSRKHHKPRSPHRLSVSTRSLKPVLLSESGTNDRSAHDAVKLYLSTIENNPSATTTCCGLSNMKKCSNYFTNDQMNIPSFEEFRDSKGTSAENSDISLQPTPSELLLIKLQSEKPTPPSGLSKLACDEDGKKKQQRTNCCSDRVASLHIHDSSPPKPLIDSPTVNDLKTPSGRGSVDTQECTTSHDLFSSFSSTSGEYSLTKHSDKSKKSPPQCSTIDILPSRNIESLPFIKEHESKTIHRETQNYKNYSNTKHLHIEGSQRNPQETSACQLPAKVSEQPHASTDSSRFPGKQTAENEQVIRFHKAEEERTTTMRPYRYFANIEFEKTVDLVEQFPQDLEPTDAYKFFDNIAEEKFLTEDTNLKLKPSPGPSQTRESKSKQSVEENSNSDPTLCVSENQELVKESINPDMANVDVTPSLGSPPSSTSQQMISSLCEDTHGTWTTLEIEEQKVIENRENKGSIVSKDPVSCEEADVHNACKQGDQDVPTIETKPRIESNITNVLPVHPNTSEFDNVRGGAHSQNYNIPTDVEHHGLNSMGKMFESCHISELKRGSQLEPTNVNPQCMFCSEQSRNHFICRQKESEHQRDGCKCCEQRQPTNERGVSQRKISQCVTEFLKWQQQFSEHSGSSGMAAKLGFERPEFQHNNLANTLNRPTCMSPACTQLQTHPDEHQRNTECRFSSSSVEMDILETFRTFMNTYYRGSDGREGSELSHQRSTGRGKTRLMKETRVQTSPTDELVTLSKTQGAQTEEDLWSNSKDTAFQKDVTAILGKLSGLENAIIDSRQELDTLHTLESATSLVVNKVDSQTSKLVEDSHYLEAKHREVKKFQNELVHRMDTMHATLTVRQRLDNDMLLEEVKRLLGNNKSDIRSQVRSAVTEQLDHFEQKVQSGLTSFSKTLSDQNEELQNKIISNMYKITDAREPDTAKKCPSYDAMKMRIVELTSQRDAEKVYHKITRESLRALERDHERLRSEYVRATYDWNRVPQNRSRTRRLQYMLDDDRTAVSSLHDSQRPSDVYTSRHSDLLHQDTSKSSRVFGRAVTERRRHSGPGYGQQSGKDEPLPHVNNAGESEQNWGRNARESNGMEETVVHRDTKENEAGCVRNFQVQHDEIKSSATVDDQCSPAGANWRLTTLRKTHIKEKARKGTADNRSKDGDANPFEGKDLSPGLRGLTNEFIKVHSHKCPRDATRRRGKKHQFDLESSVEIQDKAEVMGSRPATDKKKRNDIHMPSELHEDETRDSRSEDDGGPATDSVSKLSVTLSDTNF